jgi:D-alanyl-D-alanine carboxypeptidase
MRIKLSLFLTLLAPQFSHSLSAQPAAPAGYAAKADAIVQSYAQEGLYRGAVVVVKEGQPVFRKAYGMANSEWDIPNTPDTKFRIGSITKQFTAISVLQLAEQGKLKLDDPVAKHYEGAPAAWEKITIHHLLNHTSGIPSYTGIKDFFAKSSRNPMTPAEIVKLTQDQALEFEPGSQFKYNNTGYVLLGHVIEKASGMKYADYVRKNIFDPAGMQDSGYDTHADLLKKRATGYTPNGKIAPYLDMSLPHAAGSLYSTVDDFVKWDQALHAGKLVNGESWKLMTTPGKGDYGYGLIVKPLAGHAAMAHGGGINGFNTHFVRFPEDKVAVAVFANVNGPTADTLAASLARLYFGEDVKPREKYTAIKLTEAELDAFTGTYELAPAFSLKVKRDGAQLTVQGTNQPALPVMPYAPNKFFATAVDAQLEFTRNAEGKVESVTLHQGGRSTPGKRTGD